MVSLQNLIRYQLSEGLTEYELAEDIGVSESTIQKILRGRDPESLGIWKKLARYFHVDMELLRFGQFAFVHSPMKDQGRAGNPQLYRKVPILSWTQVRHVVEGHDSKIFLAAGQGMVETELTGARVFAMHVEDDSM
ncbi:MAG: helix-turn-helix transcriptional regulator, partial [Nitrospira sp.]|nr:helix-turn-helix transcriptional regulator [Nitrospira sp.]